MKIEDSMTTEEAGERCNLSTSTVKGLLREKERPPRLILNEECRKLGRMWLVTRAGMERFGRLEKSCF
ncbi:helix-turn-helix domain-containing protein [Veillonella montpellierensis]|uniref:helix-turn-helix domain-containing protein n=1 Tax=Veillonella montpellierensis TaxID=187328 RepID=UPI0023F88E28|nr:helix-turn-helix domain-containing protein [Veillonella montpellierensis]